MKLTTCICCLVFLCAGTGFSQVTSFSVNKQSFVSPTVESMAYLMQHIDSLKWNEVLLPLGFKSLPTSMKVNILEYDKKVNGMSQYIGYDDGYGVLTIIWKDESGKTLISGNLKKALKGKDYNTPGFYKTDYKGTGLVIGIESSKAKVINEMITVEFERK